MAELLAFVIGAILGAAGMAVLVVRNKAKWLDNLKRKEGE